MATGFLRLDWIVDVRDNLHPQLSWRARVVAFALTSWADEGGQCWPSIPTLARALGLSDKSVRRGLNELYAAGLIEWRWELKSTTGGTQTLRVFKMRRQKGVPHTYPLPHSDKGVPHSPKGGGPQGPEPVIESVIEPVIKEDVAGKERLCRCDPKLLVDWGPDPCPYCGGEIREAA